MPLLTPEGQRCARLVPAFPQTGVRLEFGVLTLAEHRLKSANSDGESTRCVLLAAGGEQPPERLMMLLDQPSTRTVTVAHPLLAAAELASFERERSVHEQPRPTSGERTVLVVVNRESWRDLSPLFRTVRIHMPEVAIWVCTERVAIEVYAGSEPVIEHSEGDLQAAQEAPPTAGMSENPEQETEEVSKVSEDELRFLLDLYDSEAHEEPEKDSPEDSATEDEP